MPLPKASMCPHRPGMSSSSSRPMLSGRAGSMMRCSPSGSRPSIVRRNNSGAPVDQACGLHAVGKLHRILRRGSVVTSESLGQPSVEEPRRVEVAGGNPGGLFFEPIIPQSPGNKRVVEGPNGTDVVAYGVITSLAIGERTDTPAAEEPRPQEVPCDGRSLGLVDDTAPQQMSDVGR